LSKTAIEALEKYKKFPVVGCTFHFTVLSQPEQKPKPLRLHLQNRPWRLKSKKAQPTAAPAISPPCAIWVLLRKTLEKTGATRLKSLESPILVEFYNSARTHFSTKC
jgi:hypothetical protein